MAEHRNNSGKSAARLAHSGGKEGIVLGRLICRRLRLSDAKPDAKAIFFSALEQGSPDDLADFLDRECGDNAELRNRVEDLLRAHQQAGNFLGGSMAVGETVDLPQVTEEPGAQIGPYKLLQQIGEGGFGVVFMAEQREPLNRRVALKIIKRGMDTREVIARFEAERQALAMMDHPNIAKILDAGATDRGRPYFVMELVKGIPLTTFCDEQKLDTHQRLEIFGDICSAVNHAHQKGIIHRDLKPSNILVTLHGDKAVPKIIDFGIAKATRQQLTDKTLFTRFEQFIGTPAYMSPEQAALSGLDIDTRSDIYSLGVVLYELLAGKPPFDSRTLRNAGYDEMRRIICEEEPPTPSTRIASLAGEERASISVSRQSDPKRLSGQVRGELDWIVMKAIEKDRGRRYETADGFALDIRRYLDGAPVTAAAPTRAYRFRKFSRRHKAPLAVASAVTLALVVGAAVTTWQAIRAEKEAERKTETLAQLRAAAPAFLLQAEDLVHLGRPADAIKKIDHALTLQPAATDFLLRKAQLLETQLRLKDAIETYRTLLEVDSDHEEAQRGLTVCNQALDFERNENGDFSTQSLAALRLGMVEAGRPASELVTVSKRFEEEAAKLKESWLERLRDLPVAGDRSLDQRLGVHPKVGRLTLDLSGAEVIDLKPLEGMPLGLLVLARCRRVQDLTPLADLPLRTLILADTFVRDLAPLRNLSHLVILNLDRTGIRDLSPLRGLSLQQLSLRECSAVRDLTPLRELPLEGLDLCGTSVSSFKPLEGMPLNWLHACGVPAQDVSYLSNLSLETLFMHRHQFTDLGFVEDMPLGMLSITGCDQARNYAVLNKIPTLQNVSLPADLVSLSEDEQSALDLLFGEQSNVRQVTDWKLPGESYAAVERKESFARRWNSLRRLANILRREGIDYVLKREDKASYNLRIRTPSFDDLSLLEEARLEAIALHRLDVHGTEVSDLSPLRGMQLEELRAYDTRVDDLAPLREIPSLKRLTLARSPVRDITPLRGLSLQMLTLDGTRVTDVSALAETNSLRTLMLPEDIADFEPLRELPLKWVSFWWDFKNHRPLHTADEFWHLDPGKFFETREAVKNQNWDVTQDYFWRRATRSLAAPPTSERALELVQAAAVLAAGSDSQPYHDLCKQIVEQYANSDDAASLERSSKAMLLVELSDPDLRDQAVRMMREAHKLSEGNSAWFHLGRVLAEHRAGNLRQSIEFATKIESDDPRINAAARALEAMANQGIGNTDTARMRLITAAEETAELMREFARRVDHNDGWHDALICRLLVSEAARLIGETGKEDE